MTNGRARAVNDDGLALLGGALTQRGLDFIPSIGNFISVAMPRDAGEVYDGLLRRGVIVRPVGGYGMPQHLRVSVGTRSENMAFLTALDDVLGE